MKLLKNLPVYHDHIFCSELNDSMLNKSVKLCGSIRQIRILSKLLFFTISDATATCQVKISCGNELFSQAKKDIKNESIVMVSGNLQLKEHGDSKTINGKYEVDVTEMQVLSPAANLPTPIKMFETAHENFKNQYRYLELRNPKYNDILKLRSKLFMLLRTFFIDNKYVDLNTPILSAPSCEGAQEFLVPSRFDENKFFALSQSPQIYKQLIMMADFQRYFQIAPCFRNEDLRSDRQYEFYQLDFEQTYLSFPVLDSLMKKLLSLIFEQILTFSAKINFSYLSFADAIERYGSDKPDLRFDFKIENLIKDQKPAIVNKSLRAIKFSDHLPLDEIKVIFKEIKKLHKSNLSYAEIKNNEIIKVIGCSKNIAKQVVEQNKLNNTSLFFCLDEYLLCSETLGAVRNLLAKALNQIPTDRFEICWILDWPVAIKHTDGQYHLTRHPFTDIFDIKTAEFIKIKHLSEIYNKITTGYDLVINGSEIGSGSLRINCPQRQLHMFQLLNLEPDVIQNQFGYFLEALKYGCPPHGGFAMGLERLIMVLTNQNTIRNTQAFSKNNMGQDLLNNSPAKIIK